MESPVNIPSSGDRVCLNAPKTDELSPCWIVKPLHNSPIFEASACDQVGHCSLEDIWVSPNLEFLADTQPCRSKFEQMQ